MKYYPGNSMDKLERNDCMKHIFEKGSSDITLLLLHGTGGTEHDLLQLGKMVAPEASILSVRGNVLENGMPRFFRRLEEGVFDEEDLIFRTKELYEFLDEASEKYGFDRTKIVAIGYSNGANIAASLLFHYEDALSGAVLHHPMVPRRGISLPNLKETHVLITAGELDPMCPAQEAIDLETLLADVQADVEVFWTPGGHQLVQGEVERAKDWFHEKF